MRYVVTALLIFGLGIAAMAPVAFAQVNVPPSGSGGGVAGGHTVCPVIGPCYEPQYSPFSGGDTN